MTQIKRNASLDGVRWIAITLVVASHTGVLGQGGLGNAIFFCLSGFMASIPFKNEVEKQYLSIKQILSYYFNRIVRIIPIYYVVIGTVYVLTKSFFTDRIHFLKNLVFLESYGHLWFLQQEMLMYVCMPFLFILLAGGKRILKSKYKDLWCAIGLFVLAFAAYKFLTLDIFYLYGNNQQQVFRIGQFLIGIALGYLYKAYNISGIDLGRHVVIKGICECIIITFLVFCVLSSEPVIGAYNSDYKGFYIGWEMPMFCTIFTAVLIAALLIHPAGICAKILGCKPIAYIGEISFGVYLVHMFLIPFFRLGSNTRNFITVYLISICIATALHIVIEKPSIILAKTKSIKETIHYYRNL